jgi:hypothetical protein
MNATNIRKHFSAIKMDLRALYDQNKFNPIASEIKTFLDKIDGLSKEYETKIILSLESQANQLGQNTTIVEDRIILYSRHGKGIDEYHFCSNCKTNSKPVYRYSESNAGVVYLCNACKVEIFNRSFDDAGPQGEDLIGGRIKSGGIWEGNRRKH